MTTEKRKINAHEIVSDIRAGLSSADLMQKYMLHPKQLNELLQRLRGQGLITRWQMFDLTTLSDSAVMQAFSKYEYSISRQLTSAPAKMAQGNNEGHFLKSTQDAASAEMTLRGELERLLRENHSQVLKPAETEPTV